MLAKRLHPSELLIGDSIVVRLSRCKTVWKKYFKLHKALDCDIAEDRTQHVLWRAGDLSKINQSCCGTKYLDHDRPKAITDAIIKTGKVFREKLSADVNVILTGLLLQGLKKSEQRNKMLKVNNYLKSPVKMKPIYIAWNKIITAIHKGQSLDTLLYCKDNLHMIKSENNKFASNASKTGLQTFYFNTIIILIFHHHLKMMQEHMNALERWSRRLLYNCLLDYPYCKENYNLIAINISKHYPFDADPKSMQ